MAPGGREGERLDDVGKGMRGERDPSSCSSIRRSKPRWHSFKKRPPT